MKKTEMTIAVRWKVAKGLTVTPAQARNLAALLVLRADTAELAGSRRAPNGYVATYSHHNKRQVFYTIDGTTEEDWTQYDLWRSWPIVVRTTIGGEVIE